MSRVWEQDEHGVGGWRDANGGSSAAIFGVVAIPSPGPDGGADVMFPLFGTKPDGWSYDGMAFTGPMTFGAGSTTTLWLVCPTVDGKTITLTYVEFRVSNGAGTEKCSVATVAPVVLLTTPSPVNSVQVANLTSLEQIGSDLSMVTGDNPRSGDFAIQSTAGGQYSAVALCSFTIE